MITRTKPLTILLALLFGRISLTDAFSLSDRPPGATSSSSSHRASSFSSFRFAPNGVCVDPAFFVEPQLCRTFTLRNVPGDGDCMFLAVALATLASMGLGGNDALLRAISKETRDVVAKVLESEQAGNLHIEKDRLVSNHKLLASAARGEGLDTAEYLRRLRREGRDGGLYGGGPELTVLANVLRRPISVYHLSQTTENGANDASKGHIQHIIRQGVFGEDFFADPLRHLPEPAVWTVESQPGAFSWHLHILVVDVVNEKHACVLLPQPDI